jgi:hypothetical protein
LRYTNCFCSAAVCAFLLIGAAAFGQKKSDDAAAPHTPTLIFYLSGATTPKDKDAIGSSVQKLKSASVVEFNAERSFVRVRFDSHIVSYHQVAQAIADGGSGLGKDYHPYLVFCVPDYSKAGNAAKVDAILAGKRLNQRVRVNALDKSEGIFVIHFLPLKIDPADSTPQGFNGGHLHHPISDPPTRGLGLPCSYASDDAPGAVPDPKSVESAGFATATTKPGG